jgi:flagellar protein FlgJ
MANKEYPYEKKLAFIQDLYCPARQCADESGCSWQLILAQAAQETGWGEKVLPGTNNVFNIKSSPDWQGEQKTFRVWEKVDGEKVWVNAPFRVYATVLDSLRDRQKFLKDNPRYARAGLYNTEVKGDLVKEAQALQRAGYATDETYAAKLKEVFDGKTMQRAIAAAKKHGCKGCLPTINVYIRDAARVALVNTKVKASQGGNTREMVTDNTGHVQVQAALSGGQISLEVWSEHDHKWIAIDEKITPTSPPTAVTLIGPTLVIDSSTQHHEPVAAAAATGAPPAPAPASAPAHAATTSTHAASTQADGGHDASHPALENYTIKKGDSLSRIAKAHSTSYLTIARLNGIASPYYVYPGQVLKVPKQKPAAASSPVAPAAPQRTVPPAAVPHAAPSQPAAHPASAARTSASAATAGSATGQSNVPTSVLRPDNTVHAVHLRNETDHPQTDVLSGRRAPWMAIAEQEFHAGVKRRGGANPDQHIEEYFTATSLGRQHTDSIAYCAAFVNWCMTRAGFRGNNNAMANSLATWGKSTQGNKPAYGAVAVVHIPPHNSPHVTFVNGAAAFDPSGNVVRIATLGGNQGHAHEVSMSSMPASWVVHYRFPSDYVESPEDYHLTHAATDNAQMTASSTH